ncbi:MAG: Cyanophage, partial [Pseudomonadota bacterium]
KQKEIDYSDLIRYDELRAHHPAHKILEQRKINGNLLQNFYYCPNFFQWASQYKPEFSDLSEQKIPRLIIPFYDENNRSYVFQARTFDSSVEPKYYTIKSYDDAVKLYGLNKVDKLKTTYVFEGPIDSMFIENSIAVCSSSLVKTFYKYDTKIKSPVFVWDNEPRNREIVKLMEDAIEDGHHIVIWPSYISHKDINDMIVSGHDVKDLQLILKNHTYSGVRAKLEITKWKKV